MNVNIDDIKKIFSKAFGQKVNIDVNTKRDDIKLWDSINTLNLIVELEDFYKVSFTREEIEGMNSVRFIIDLLQKKQ